MYRHFFLFSFIISIGFCKFLNLWFYSCSVEWVAVYLCGEENNSVLSRPDCARHSAPPRFRAQKYLRFWAQIFLRFWNSQVIISCCPDSARHWALPRFYFMCTKIFRISLKIWNITDISKSWISSREIMASLKLQFLWLNFSSLILPLSKHEWNELY